MMDFVGLLRIILSDPSSLAHSELDEATFDETVNDLVSEQMNLLTTFPSNSNSSYIIGNRC